jgi:hypothetical protein
MRTKKEYKVITFSTTSDAMAMEKFCEKNNINGRLIPVPREISAGCGLAWRMLPECFTELEKYIIVDKTLDINTKISTGEFEIKVEQIISIKL